MKHKIYCIRDAQAGAYLPPFVLPTNGMATRVFSDMCNDKSHQFGAHPEDYTLWHIGQYDDSTGTIDPEAPQIALGKGIDYLNTPEIHPDLFASVEQAARPPLKYENGGE